MRVMKLIDYIECSNLTFQAFGDRLGVSGEAVRLWATGGRTPRPMHMNAISRETDGRVTPNDFFGETAA